MAKDNLKERIPVELIIASFKGEIKAEQESELASWLSIEDNKAKYEALKRLGHHTVSNATACNSSKGYGTFRRRVSNIWKKVAVAASVAALVAITCTTYHVLNPVQIEQQTYRCVTGKSIVELPDGSEVVLHKGSSLSYDNAFSKTNRNVRLEGEAFFDVAEDKENRFTLSVDGLDVTVYGTSFNVFEDNESVTVSLVEGSVEVSAQNDVRCLLSPGHSAIYDKETGCLIDRKDDVAFASCWAKDRLTFTQASLGEVCRYLSKWYGVQIVVPDELKLSCSYTFTIKDEPIDQILDIMSRINPMKYLYTNDYRIIISEIH